MIRRSEVTDVGGSDEGVRFGHRACARGGMTLGCVLAPLGPRPGPAGTTGKIAGRVVDGEEAGGVGGTCASRREPARRDHERVRRVTRSSTFPPGPTTSSFAIARLPGDDRSGRRRLRRSNHAGSTLTRRGRGRAGGGRGHRRAASRWIWTSPARRPRSDARRRSRSSRCRSSRTS